MVVLVDLVGYTGKKGGTDVYTRELYRHISKLSFDWEFTALASKESKRLDLSWFPGKIEFSSFSGNSKIQWAFAEVISMQIKAFKDKPRLIHCPANFGPLIRTSRILLTIHDMIYWAKPNLVPNPFLIPGVRILQKKIIKNSDFLITDSFFSNEEILKFHKIPTNKIKTIYLGSQSNNLVESSKFGFSEYFLAGGNRFGHKNWNGLIEAFSLIPEDIRPKLYITGGRSPDPLKNLINYYHLNNYIELLDWVDEEKMQNLYIGAKAVIVPSFYEGFSLPVMQAMNLGKPIIASEIPVHLEIAGQVAHFFDPESPKSIAVSIINFLNAPESQIQAKVKLGLERSDGTTWQRCAVETLEVMKLLLENEN